MMFSKRNSKPITLMFMIDTYVSMPNASLSGGTEKQLYLLASSINWENFRPIVVQLSPDASIQVPKGHMVIWSYFIFQPGGCMVWMDFVS